MSDRIQIEELEVIGYADVLPDSMVPTVVPPVFRSKGDLNRIFLPPYHMAGNFLYDPSEVSQAELQHLEEDEKVTRFAEAQPAKPGHELWIDRGFQPHYETHSLATRNLLRIFDDCISRAIEALSQRNTLEADRLSGIAACADDRKAAPFAIKAAIRRFESNQIGVELMAELAGRTLSRAEFDTMVDHYYACIPQTGRSPMSGVANPDLKAA